MHEKNDIQQDISPFKHEKLPTRFRTTSPQCYDKKNDINEILIKHQMERGRLTWTAIEQCLQ